MSAPSLTAVAGPRRALAVTAAGMLLVGVALFFFWPLGVAIGVAMGVVVVLGLGRQQERAEHGEPAVPLEDLLGAVAAEPERPAAVVARPAAVVARPALEAAAPAQPQPVVAPEPVVAPAAAQAAPEAQGVRADLVRLKSDLGDDYPDFARAARLVVSTQYASAARLQRDLQLPYSRARRLLADLETEHFVGPATGTLPRQVLLPKERLPEVERLFAGV